MSENNGLVLKERIRKELQKIIENEQINGYEIQLNRVTSEGDNNIGVLIGIAITGKNKDLHLICKSESENKFLQKEFRTDVMFECEKFFYLKLFPLYERFQKTRGIGVEEGFFNYPKCYGFSEAGIFMEDLRKQNYTMLDRKDGMKYEYVKLTLETLGKFHAMGLAIKDQWPEEFIKCKSYLGEDLYGRPIHEGTYNYFRASLKFARSTLEDHEEYLKDKITRVIENLEDLLPDAISGEYAEPYATFTHGDFWNNNILFKHDNVGQPVGACILDYQLSRYSSPATDLTEYFFTHTTQDFRDKYYTKLLRTYHQSVSTVLEKLGSDPNKVFPFAALEDQIRKFGIFGFTFSSIMIKIILSRGNENFDTQKIAEMMGEEKDFQDEIPVISDEETNDLYKKRMSDVIRHASNIGII